MTPTLNQTQDPSKLRPGQCLGKYRLQRHLATGGFCDVWKARDTVEGISVALKLPLPDTTGRRSNDALLKEVRLLAQLRHPHIMPVKNADVINGQAILATELSTGTLDDRSKPMSTKRILAIMDQVLDGLAYAHRRKLVHCDVTPANIFLLPNDRATLGDFGISLQLKGRMVTVDEYGTPGYVAPEQAFGRPTCRSDCFSVALVLYEYITGYLPRWPFRWPFRGADRLRQRTSPALVKLIRRATSVDPAKRFAHAGEMLTALRSAGAGLYGNASSRPRPPVDWREVRRQAFLTRYAKVLHCHFRCVDCHEPISESMLCCPFCGSERNRFDTQTAYSHYCPDCRKGVLTEWRFCPFCYGPGFASPTESRTTGVRYHDYCRHCQGRLIRFMQYCPWCHRKVRRPWRAKPFPDSCPHCRWSVDTKFWTHCPWCKASLVT